MTAPLTKNPADLIAVHKPLTPGQAKRRQQAYAASRRAWAEAVGRPYGDESDPRPPPGELDAEPDE
jgi:hypothetical protein